MKKILLLFVSLAFSQWSSDPSSPQLLGAGVQAQVKATSDGGVYIAWLTDMGGYHVYLQRFDSEGIPQFDDGGMLISNHNNSSWIAVFHMNLEVDSENNAIGTSSAWFYDLNGQHYGLIHFVAIIPEWQGCGLAKPLMSTICNLLKELGHDKGLLYTQSMRYPAIKLYSRLGFVPFIRNEKEQIAWDVILDKIKADYRV